MRIGVTVPNIHETLATPTTIEAVGRTADDLGLDSVWCNDHLAIRAARDDGGAEPAYAAAYGEDRGQHIYEPLIVLAYLAAATRRVMLGTSVYLLALRHPVLAGPQGLPIRAGGRAGRLDRSALRRAPGAGRWRRLAGERVRGTGRALPRARAADGRGD